MTASGRPAKSSRGRPAERSPSDVFEDTIADAERLVLLSEALQNERKRRMRRERRQAISSAVRTSKRDQQLLDIAENDQVLIVLKPNSRCTAQHFEEIELRPLLRQAVVAIAAAVESYVAEKAKAFVPDACRAQEPPKRLLDITLTVDDLLDIERRYTRRAWGHYALIWQHIDHAASANPASIGKVFSLVGKTGIWKKVDNCRGVKQGESERQLGLLARRRDTIAHTGDRRGGGKAAIDAREVSAYLANARAIVQALEEVLV